MKQYLITLTLLLLSNMAFSAEKTVTLEVPGMTCITCPITVSKALEKVDGVKQVKVTYEDKLAVVTFDDDKVKVAQLTEATKNAGYPSRLKQN